MKIKQTIKKHWFLLCFLLVIISLCFAFSVIVNDAFQESQGTFSLIGELQAIKYVQDGHGKVVRTRLYFEKQAFVIDGYFIYEIGEVYEVTYEEFPYKTKVISIEKHEGG